MRAAVDVGSNTVRLLIGQCSDGQAVSSLCLREVTRLGGNFSMEKGLAEESIERTVAALEKFASCIASWQVPNYRAIATEAVRRARNSQYFLDEVYRKSGLQLDIISGDEEADLTSTGVLSVISPLPRRIVLIDIGGGSTELICLVDGQKLFQESYPLGVVRLAEEYDSAISREHHVSQVLSGFYRHLQDLNCSFDDWQVVGTAGTVTTLAAMHLKLDQYDPDIVNNHSIPIGWLYDLKNDLEELTISQREQLTGMEPGRGDLIIPGIEILLNLLQHLESSTLKISDSGLLEGTLLSIG